VSNLPVGVSAAICNNLPVTIGQNCIITLSYPNTQVGQLASFKPWIYINNNVLIPIDKVPATSLVNIFDPSKVTASLDSSFPSFAQAEQGSLYAVYTIHNTNPVPLVSVDANLPTTLSLPISIATNACQTGVGAGADCKLTLALDTNQQIGENAPFSPSIMLDKTTLGSTAPTVTLPEMNATAVYSDNTKISVTLKNNIPTHVLLNSGSYTATYSISAPFSIQAADITLDSNPDYMANISCQPSNGASTCTIQFTLKAGTARSVSSYKPIITINPKQQTIDPKNIAALNAVTIDNIANITIAVEKNFPAFQLSDYPATATLKITNNEAQLDHFDSVNLSSLAPGFTISRNTCTNVVFGSSCELDIQNNNLATGIATFSAIFSVVRNSNEYTFKDTLPILAINVLGNARIPSLTPIVQITEDPANHQLFALTQSSTPDSNDQQIYVSSDAGETWNKVFLALDSLPAGSFPQGTVPTITHIVAYQNTLYAIIRYPISDSDWSSYIISSPVPASASSFTWQIFGKDSDFDGRGHNFSMCVNTNILGSVRLYNTNALGVYERNLTTKASNWTRSTNFEQHAEAKNALVICDSNLSYIYLVYQELNNRQLQIYSRLFYQAQGAGTYTLDYSTKQTNIDAIAAQFDVTNKNSMVYVMQNINNQFTRYENDDSSAAPMAMPTTLPDGLTTDELKKLEATDDSVYLFTNDNVLYISTDDGMTWTNVSLSFANSINITNIQRVNSEEILVQLADNRSYFLKAK
jgi:hypothetical protein